MNICAVIVTYNRKELLIECIDALLNQSYELKDILIIDNNSNDGTWEYIKENELDDKIIYKKLDKNIGGAGGFHEGIKEAIDGCYDWIWIMDDDTIPTKKALEELINGINDIKETNIGFVSSKVVGTNNEEMNVPNISRRLDENEYPIWMKYLNKSIVEVESATFVSTLINIDAIKKVGLPWKEFFIWGDDIEYTLRISRNFGTGYVVGKSIVIHKRKSAKNLSLIDEYNLDRLNMYKYKYRNDIIISNNYNSFKVRIKVIINTSLYGIKALFKSRKYKLKKFNIVFSSMLVALFNFKIKSSFNKRMSYE